jgi:hypothetical protein
MCRALFTIPRGEIGGGIPRGADGSARARRQRSSRSAGRPPRRGCLDERNRRRAKLHVPTRTVGFRWTQRANLRAMYDLGKNW